MGIVGVRAKYLFSLFILLVSAEVSAGILTWCFCLPMVVPAWRKLKLFFATPSYIVHKATWCVPYVHQATNDDIDKERYIYLDLFSKKHHHAIVKVSLEDDVENERTEVTSYEVNHDLLPINLGNATIGTVYYYNQLLEKHHTYETRTVITYKDSLNRFCVLIQSFDSFGNRVTMNIFRQRRRVWWLKNVMSEGSSITSAITDFFKGGFLTTKKTKTQILNVIESNCPIGMANHKSDFYDIIYSKSTENNAGGIGSIIFRNMPEEPTPGATDLFVWRYFTKGKREDITYVVIAELVPGYVMQRYYRCLSPADQHYEAVDSFAHYGDIPASSIVTLPSSYATSNIDLVLNFNTPGGNVYPPGLLVFAYPDTHQYVVRSISKSESRLFKTVKIRGPQNEVEFENAFPEGITFLSISDVSNANYKKISLSYLGTYGFVIQGDVLIMKESMYIIPSAAEQHTAYFLKHTLPTYYLPIPLKSTLFPSKSKDFHLDGYAESDVVGAQLDASTTFYTPNLFGSHNFKRCFFNRESPVELEHTFNTQVMFFEHERVNIAAVFGGRMKEALLYEVGQTTTAKLNRNKYKDILQEHGILEYELLGQNKPKVPIEYVELDLNEPSVHRNIDVLLISSTVVLYRPSTTGVRISSVYWGYEMLSFKDTSDINISIITSNYISYLLVDEVDDETRSINRYLYVMEPKPVPTMRIIAQYSCDTKEGTVSDLRRCVQNSWYHLIPQKLPLLCDPNDKRLGSAQYQHHKLNVYYMHLWHEFAIGVVKVGGRFLEPLEHHKWRQYHTLESTDGYNDVIYTMTPEGIKCQMINSAENKVKEKTIPYIMETHGVSDSDSTVLLVDDPGYSKAKEIVSKVGNVTFKTIKPGDGVNYFNPIVFGHHEIHLSDGYSCKKVIVSINDRGLRQVDLDMSHRKGSCTVTFTESAKGSRHYILNEDDVGVVPFVDISKDMYDYELFFYNLYILDFNRGHFPHHIRYLTLTDHMMYFTGFAPKGGLKVKFGDHDFIVPDFGFTFHIWVSYPHDTSQVASIYLRFDKKNKEPFSQFFTLEDVEQASKLQKPHGSNCNWGVLSNMEFRMVNELLVRSFLTRGELEAVALDLNSSEHHPCILKVNIDETTSLYTTLASCNNVIGDVDLRGVIIKGAPRQIVKHVYHSSGNNSEVVLVVTRTVREVIVKAYSFSMNNAFESVDLKSLDAKAHPAIYNIMKLASQRNSMHK